MNVHNNVGQKPVELYFWSFSLNFLWILITKNWKFWRFLAIGSLSFHPIFPIFGLNVHNNIAHKICWTRIFIFCFKLFYGFLIIINRSKLGILEVFGHFLKKFLMPDPETWFTGILRVLPNVCEKWPPWATFSAPFWHRIEPKYVNMSVFVYFLQNLPLEWQENWFISTLELFCRCVCSNFCKGFLITTK